MLYKIKFCVKAYMEDFIDKGFQYVNDQRLGAEKVFKMNGKKYFVSIQSRSGGIVEIIIKSKRKKYDLVNYLPIDLKESLAIYKMVIKDIRKREMRKLSG